MNFFLIVMDKIAISNTKFNELHGLVSCQYRGEKGTVVGTTFYNNLEYAITGYMSKAGHCSEYYGNQVIDLNKYTGKLKPLDIHEHRMEVDFEKRERGYTGLIVNLGVRKLVMLKPVCFINSGSGLQSSLF